MADPHLVYLQVCSEVLTLQPGVASGMTSSCRGQSARYILIRRVTRNQPAGLVHGLPICSVQVYDVLPQLSSNMPAEDGPFRTLLADANGDMLADVITHR